jgi:penicillin-binding protein-related factor A (putative recombinase)
MNSGKIFERDIKNSIPKGTYCKKLQDAAIGFNIENSEQRFSPQSPYDYFIYHKPYALAIECKTVLNGGMSFDGSNPMIKKHQIEELIKAAECEMIAGLLCNFRDTEHTYFLPIAQFEFLRQTIGKKSFNEKDIKGLAIVIPSRKLKVNYRYDLTVLWR